MTSAMKCLFTLALSALIAANYGNPTTAPEEGNSRPRVVPTGLKRDYWERDCYFRYSDWSEVDPNDWSIQRNLSSCMNGTVMRHSPMMSPMTLDFSDYYSEVNESFTICLETDTIYTITDVTDSYQPTEFNFERTNPQDEWRRGGNGCIPSHGSKLKLLFAPGEPCSICPAYIDDIVFRRERQHRSTAEPHVLEDKTTTKPVAIEV